MGFNIYLHDRGQFWPGLEMGEGLALKFYLQCCILGRIGLSYAKFLPKDTEWEGSFEVLLMILQNFLLKPTKTCFQGAEKDSFKQRGHCLL